MASLKEQTLTREQMARLKELGVDTTKASVVLIYKTAEGNEVDWEDVKIIDGVPSYINFLDETNELYPAYHDAETGDYDHSYRESCGVFTFDDIWSMLPKIIVSENVNYEIYLERTDAGYRCWSGAEIDHVLCHFDLMKDYYTQINDTTLLYNMLCWVAEHGYLNKE